MIKDNYRDLQKLGAQTHHGQRVMVVRTTLPPLPCRAVGPSPAVRTTLPPVPSERPDPQSAAVVPDQAAVRPPCIPPRSPSWIREYSSDARTPVGYPARPAVPTLRRR